MIGARPKGREIVAAMTTKKWGKLLTELSKRTADMGIQVGFHNHMDSLGKRPEEVDWIFAGTDRATRN